MLFARAALYMQSLLQVFYLVMAVYGFIDWRKGRTADGEVVIRSWTLKQHAMVAVLVIIASVVNGWLLAHNTDAAAPYIDSFVTWGSVVTTWMVARRMIENWLYWIVVDAVAAWLYFTQGLLATTLLFMIYLGIVVRGYFVWRREQAQQRLAESLRHAVERRRTGASRCRRARARRRRDSSRRADQARSHESKAGWCARTTTASSCASATRPSRRCRSIAHSEAVVLQVVARAGIGPEVLLLRSAARRAGDALSRRDLERARCASGENIQRLGGAASPPARSSRARGRARVDLASTVEGYLRTLDERGIRSRLTLPSLRERALQVGA